MEATALSPLHEKGPHRRSTGLPKALHFLPVRTVGLRMLRAWQLHTRGWCGVISVPDVAGFFTGERAARPCGQSALPNFVSCTKGGKTSHD